MQSSGAERTISEIRQPLSQAYTYLSPSVPRIHATWSKMLTRYESCRQHAPLLASLHLAHRLRDVRVVHPRTYRMEVEGEGLDLARQEVPVECPTLAVALYAESCIACLFSGDPRTIAWRRALLRWASVHQFFLLCGYSRQISLDRQDWLDKAAAAERKSQDFSVELGDAYEKERRRLAQDLHDEIGHDLIVLKLYTQMIALDLKSGDVNQLRRKLRETVGLINHALKGVRHLVFDLGPAVWSEQGFVPAVRAYSRQFAVRTGIHVRFDARRLQTKLPARYETALYKALQGALSNVAAHASARHAKITLASRRDCVVMRVEDDGKGFNVGRKLQTVPKSYGLRAMRDRIELLGGTIEFQSRPARKGSEGSGTTLEFHLPLQESELR